MYFYLLISKGFIIIIIIIIIVIIIIIIIIISISIIVVLGLVQTSNELNNCLGWPKWYKFDFWFRRQNLLVGLNSVSRCTMVHNAYQQKKS